MNQELTSKFPYLESFDVPVVVVDDPGQICWGNQRFLERFPDAECGVNFIGYLCDRVPSRDRESAWFNLNALLSGNSRRETVRLGVEHPVEVSLLPVAGPGVPEGGKVLMLQVAVADGMFSRRTILSILDACDNLFSLTEDEVHLVADSDEAPNRLKKLFASKIIKAAKRLFLYEILELRILDEETGRLQLYASFGLSDAATAREVYAREDCGIIGHVAMTGRPYLCQETSRDCHYITGGDQACSSLTVPIFHGSTLVGVLNIESSSPSGFTEKDTFILSEFAQKIAVLLYNGRLLLTAKTGGGKITASHVHARMAPSVSELGTNLGLIYDAVTASGASAAVQNSILIHLHFAGENWKQLDNLVKKVARMFPTTDVNPRPEDVPEWHQEFRNKRILLVETDENTIGGISALFERVGARLAVARTGDAAVNAISNALTVGDPFYAVLTATSKISDRPSVSKFILEMGRLYNGVHPPFVFLVPLMEIGNTGGGNHAVTDNRARFPAAERVAKKAKTVGKVDERELFEAIRKVVLAAPHTPVFYDMDSAKYIQQRLAQEGPGNDAR